MAVAGGFGIEEEYLLVDVESGGLLSDPSPAVRGVCEEELAGHFAEEMFRCQIELVSPVFYRLDLARAFIAERRERLARRLAVHGAAILCAGSHPHGGWPGQQSSPAPHFRQLFEDYRQVARRSVVCGLHVHVGVPDGVDRIGVINRIRGWLPLLLLLSASSPFWEGEDTGYYSYRRILCSGWPRMGLPEPLADWAAYERYRSWLYKTGSLRADNDCWWALRPSRRFPTVELRIADACPRLDDGLCVTGLFRQMVAWAVAQPEPAPAPGEEQCWRDQENYWRAMRMGRNGAFLDTGNQAQNPSRWLERLAAILEPSSDEAIWAFDQAEAIVRHGSSADRQMISFTLARQSGATRQRALRQVVHELVRETRGA